MPITLRGNPFMNISYIIMHCGSSCLSNNTLIRKLFLDNTPPPSLPNWCLLLESAKPPHRGTLAHAQPLR